MMASVATSRGSTFEKGRKIAAETRWIVGFTAPRIQQTRGHLQAMHDIAAAALWRAINPRADLRVARFGCSGRRSVSGTTVWQKQRPHERRAFSMSQPRDGCTRGTNL